MLDHAGILEEAQMNAGEAIVVGTIGLIALIVIIGLVASVLERFRGDE